MFYQPKNFYIVLNLILISTLHIRPRKHIIDTNYIVKIIHTFYQQQPHKYFNLIIFNEILIWKLRNSSEVQLWNSLRMTEMCRNM